MNEQEQNDHVAESKNGILLRNLYGFKRVGDNLYAPTCNIQMHIGLTLYGLDESNVVSTMESSGIAIDFLPESDLNHAEKALVQWLEDDQSRDYNSTGACDGEHMFTLLQNNPAKSITIYNKSLSAAITEALCMVTGYKEVSG